MLLLVMCRYASAPRTLMGPTGGATGGSSKRKGGMATLNTGVRAHRPHFRAAERGPDFSVVLALRLVCVVVAQCVDDEGLTGMLEIDFVMFWCHFWQTTREEELRAC